MAVSIRRMRGKVERAEMEVERGGRKRTNRQDADHAMGLCAILDGCVNASLSLVTSIAFPLFLARSQIMFEHQEVLFDIFQWNTALDSPLWM
jgi:hypothetical protein